MIESKMVHAKSWLKDPHGQPGMCVYFLSSLSKTMIQPLMSYHNCRMVCCHPQENPVK